MDNNAKAQKVAQSISGGKVRYEQEDMRSLETIPDTFDAITCISQSFGNFDEVTNAGIIRQISENLIPNGGLILDIYLRGFLERHQGERQVERRGKQITVTNMLHGNRLKAKLDYGGDTAPDKIGWSSS